ncbi:MAG: D-glycerate dehydrogenase [Longimicrobiales bacterium]
MSRPHIFITRRIPDPGLEILQASEARVTICQEDEEQGVSREELLDGVKSCDVLLSLLTEPVDREVLAYENLLGVANMAVGFNNIDVDAATELGVPVSNTPGVLTDTTADLTWTLILAVARRVPEAHNYMVAGRYKLWGPNLFLGGDVSPGGSGRRKVLGIVGYGRIGQAVAKRARGFEMEVLAYDPYNREGVESSDFASWAELSELLAISDFVTLHPLLTEETHHLIGEAELQSMKSTAYLINASRGPVVEEKALVRALDEGWIAGAALDVYEEEPAMAEGLAELANVVLLPHIASASTDTRGKMAAIAATNALAHLRRERAPNIVNPEVYDTEPYRRRAGG